MDVIAAVPVDTRRITFRNLPIGFEVSLGEKNLARHFAWHRGFARTTGTMGGEEVRES
jgi:hypothetical protein